MTENQKPAKNKAMLQKFKIWVLEISWWAVGVGVLTLGLAPFYPPHLLNHGKSLILRHSLTAIDQFDLFYHSLPWLILLTKGTLSILMLMSKKPVQN